MLKVLTIAGSDSCSGAGIQADLKTISSLGGYGLCVITAVTAQNTRQVSAVQEINPNIVKAQLEAIFNDIPIDAVKIGMLYSPEIIKITASFLKQINPSIPVVLDPVMVAKSGDSLLKKEAVSRMVEELFPLSTVITPNLPEAEVLLGYPLKNISDMEKGAAKLLEKGSKWVIIKGGHLPENPIDIIAGENGIHHLFGEKIPVESPHGTGCTFSSALAYYLAREKDIVKAAQKAKQYVEKTIKESFTPGKGSRILNHFPNNKEGL
ncbi:bifunctional hydroxymethylpyrimidine kinase/phosphomethylpyrimidine kinase [Thermosyntropha sp.]|uniref:bifunctional hydroxymethylpyrimidine kinase/phosphomethylpyrimidine kinase n=1 Tax=Thermosyntropha sp. TaxID=2740820 RepID=UPI0025F2FA97|nr:bifunctional hydroxymethylpyrimidine kinase/phosphomethylpyrimidine kinase [Thermosyntropha sp.]MBO8158295.1 bifunctional hydroxymethylpyrimidine kinase/phosphomethylpyrimidine kinase [Thermosyntropha sp.]